MFTIDQKRKMHEIISSLNNTMQYYKFLSPIHEIEAKYTFHRIHQILSETSLDKLHINLIEFFEQRWTMIQGCDAQYCHDLQSPANKVCIVIANELAKVTKKPYLYVLMPTLSSVDIEYISSSPDDDPKIAESILTDDSSRIINVIDVLNYAKNDGILKLNSMINEKIEELKPTEFERFMGRHEKVLSTYNLIQSKVSLTRHGNTAGAAVNRLIVGLTEGNVRNGGKEEDSGASANVAIVEFAEYLEALDEKTRDKVLNTQIFDRRLSTVPEMFTIRKCWNYLKRKARDNYLDYNYCVEMIAMDLKEILEANQDLYQLAPDQKILNSNNLAKLENKIIKKLEKLGAALDATNNHKYYKEDGDTSLFLILVNKIIHDKSFVMDTLDMAYIAEQTITYKRNSDILCYESGITLLKFIDDNIPSSEVELMLDQCNRHTRNMWFHSVAKKPQSIKNTNSTLFTRALAGEKRKRHENKQDDDTELKRENAFRYN